LLDDNNTVGLDDTLMVLDGHPRIEVRLFNPFLRRTARMIDYPSDLSLLHRRIHNKSLSADDQATTIGGPTIGDEDFDAVPEASLAVLDVLAVGPIVAQVAADFDRYWASASAYPVADLVAPPSVDVAQARLAALAGAAAARAGQVDPREFLH